MIKKKVIGLIPARLGSKRVKCKNLRLINGRPLISYCIEKVKKVRCFDEVCVNSESALIGKVAERYGIEWYSRPDALALSTSMIDEYIYEFLCHRECDVLAVINPTSPFLTVGDMEKAVDQFLNSDCQTQLCCEAVQTHCFLNGRAINFNTNGQHPRSQDLAPVLALNFAITIWDAKALMRQYEEKGHGVYTGKLGFYKMEGFANVDIDYEDDFALARVIMENYAAIRADSKTEYDPVLDQVIADGFNTEK
jgi:CMP-N-acetylneuraminic acid synthetase